MTAVGRSPRRVLDDATGIAIRRLEDRIRELEAATRNISSNTGGTAVTYGSVSSEVVGGPNVDGAATKAARSDHIHALPGYGSTAGTFCQGNDSRLSDSRTPTGTAGGDLSGTYPNPSVAALHETSGPTQLTLGAWADGQALTRSGTAAVGANYIGFPTEVTASLTIPAGQGVVVPGPLIIDGGVTLTVGAGATLQVLEESDAYSYATVEPPQLRPHACDDDFTTGVLAAKWSKWDPASVMVAGVDQVAQAAFVSGPGSGSDRVCGIYQAIPNAEFVFEAYVGTLSNGIGRWTEGGIMVAGDIAGNPTTAKFESAMIFSGNSGTAGDFGVLWNSWTKFDTVSVTNGIVVGAKTACWLRARVNGTSVMMEWSDDPYGMTWMPLRSAVITTTFTPVYFGICGDFVLNGGTGYTLARRFRVKSGPGSSAAYPAAPFAQRLYKRWN